MPKKYKKIVGKLLKIMQQSSSSDNSSSSDSEEVTKSCDKKRKDRRSSTSSDDDRHHKRAKNNTSPIRNVQFRPSPSPSPCRSNSTLCSPTQSLSRSPSPGPSSKSTTGAHQPHTPLNNKPSDPQATDTSLEILKMIISQCTDTAKKPTGLTCSFYNTNGCTAKTFHDALGIKCVARNSKLDHIHRCVFCAEFLRGSYQHPKKHCKILKFCKDNNLVEYTNINKNINL